jgi:hypothetical protein
LEFWISKASQPCIGSSPTNMPLCQKSVRAMHAPMQESHNHAWSHVHAPQLMLDFMITEQGMCIFEKAPQRLLTLWLQSKACAFLKKLHKGGWLYDYRARHVHFGRVPTVMQIQGRYSQLSSLSMHALVPSVHEHASDEWLYGSEHTCTLKCHMHANNRAQASKQAWNLQLQSNLKKTFNPTYALRVW